MGQERDSGFGDMSLCVYLMHFMLEGRVCAYTYLWAYASVHRSLYIRVSVMVRAAACLWFRLSVYALLEVRVPSCVCPPGYI